MGRTAGHLALGIGKAAGATLTLIREEFPTQQIRFETIVDTLACRHHQAACPKVAWMAWQSLREGLVLGLDPELLGGMSKIERDAHGNVRLAEIDIGRGS